jgi:hypothetical protein
MVFRITRELYGHPEKLPLCGSRGGKDLVVAFTIAEKTMLVSLAER